MDNWLEKVLVFRLGCSGSALGKTKTNVVSPNKKRLNVKNTARKKVFSLFTENYCYRNLLDPLNGISLLLGEPRVPASSAKLKMASDLLLEAVKHD